MIDIYKIKDGEDLILRNSVAPKAANVVGTQLGSLAYAPNFGVDLKYFLQNELQFQNESFKAYLVERLTYHQINVAATSQIIEPLISRYTYTVGDANEKMEGLIR